MTLFETKFSILLLIFGVFLSAANCKDISRLVDKSGNVFVVEINTDEPNRAEIVERAVKVVENRINAVGIDGEVSKSPDKDDQIIVKIYGSHDWEKLKKFLFTTNRLQLKAVNSSPSPAPVKTYPTRADAAEFVREDEEILPYTDSRETGESFVNVKKDDIINGADIRDAEAVNQTGTPDSYQISFSIKPEGAKKFGAWTGTNINNYLAVVLDDEVQSVAFIKSQIFDTGEISGRFTKQTAEDIALSLKSGYLPAKMKPIEEKPFKK